MITLEHDAYCTYCGENLTENNDITIRNNNVYHNECLSENLKEGGYDD